MHYYNTKEITSEIDTVDIKPLFGMYDIEYYFSKILCVN